MRPPHLPEYYYLQAIKMLDLVAVVRVVASIGSLPANSALAVASFEEACSFAGYLPTDFDYLVVIAIAFVVWVDFQPLVCLLKSY